MILVKSNLRSTENILNSQENSVFETKSEYISGGIKTKIGDLGIPFSPNDWGNFSVIDKDGSRLTKINNKFISLLSDEDLIKYLYENNIEKLDISKLSGSQLTRLNHILTDNFPLIEIFRLNPGDKLININIGGIKQINDIAGQEFCDKIILKFKELIKINFQKANLDQSHKGRIVKNDYKNLAFVTNSTNPLKLLFGDIKTKKEIIENVLENLSYDIEKNARNILKEQEKKGEITISSINIFEELVKQKIIDTKEVVRNYFDFGIGEDIVSEDNNPISKLDNIRKAEISSRSGGEKNPYIELKNIQKIEIIKNLYDVLDLEKNIIEKFNGQKFTFEGIRYNIVTNNNGILNLSTELLRYIRKYPEKVKPNELVLLTKDYINKLNNSLDFISPVRGDLETNNIEFINAGEINNQFKSGIINTLNLFYNFKGGLTKIAFLEITKTKAGIRGTIDIKDMGIDNLVDFNLKAKQIIKLEEDFKAGLIDIEIYKAKQTKLFLETGKSVSDKFIEVQKRIKTKYPNALLRFGGDEIEFFIPIDKITKTQEIQKDITNSLNASNMQARIVLDITNGSDDNKEAYSKLERLTKLNKIIEENIEKQLIKKGLNLNGNIPNQTYMNMQDLIRTKILSEGFYLDDFFKKVKDNIQNIDLIQDGKIDIFLGEIENGIKITLIKNINNEIEIYLHN